MGFKKIFLNHMTVGICYLSLYLLEQPNSLKGKRKIVQKMKERVKSKFNVAIAEVGNNNLWQRVNIGISFVSKNTKDARSLMDKILHFLEKEFYLEITNKIIEFHNIKE